MLVYGDIGSDAAEAQRSALVDVIPALILAAAGVFELRRKAPRESA